jgi:hypothetical protein
LAPTADTLDLAQGSIEVVVIEIVQRGDRDHEIEMLVWGDSDALKSSRGKAINTHAVAPFFAKTAS